MAFSTLYHSILGKPFFVDLRRVDANAVLIARLLEHDIEGFGTHKLSDKQLTAHVVATASGGGAVVGDRFDKAPEGSVAVIPLKGDMMKEGTACAYGTEELAQLLMEATASGKIIGTVLDVDSGGGCVDAIAPMADAIQHSQRAGKPVVASCDLCASAAYYVSSYCNRIVANNQISAEFGSIGVMMQFPDYAKYYEKAGVKIHTIYSDLSDYKNAPFEAARRGDYKAIKEEELNPLARQFQEAVRQNRKNLNQKVEGILAGRMFYAPQALEYGLIDLVGTFADAVGEVRRLSAEMSLERYAANL